MQQLEECPTQWVRVTPSPRSSLPHWRAWAAMLAGSDGAGLRP